jgi:hypothetical protein
MNQRRVVRCERVWTGDLLQQGAMETDNVSNIYPFLKRYVMADGIKRRI